MFPATPDTSDISQTWLAKVASTMPFKSQNFSRLNSNDGPTQFIGLRCWRNCKSVWSEPKWILANTINLILVDNGQWETDLFGWLQNINKCQLPTADFIVGKPMNLMETCAQPSREYNCTDFCPANYLYWKVFCNWTTLWRKASVQWQREREREKCFVASQTLS